MFLENRRKAPKVTMSTKPPTTPVIPERPSVSPGHSFLPAEGQRGVQPSPRLGGFVVFKRVQTCASFTSLRRWSWPAASRASVSAQNHSEQPRGGGGGGADQREQGGGLELTQTHASWGANDWAPP